MSEVLTERRRRELLEDYFRNRQELVTESGETFAVRSLGTAVPLTFAQQQLWLHAQLAPDSALYNEPLTVRHRGALDVHALEQAFSEIVRRHQAWRTVFPPGKSEPIQRVLPPFFVALPEIDLRDLPADEREKDAMRIASADARLPYDLSEGPLFRAKLVRLGDEEHRLFVTLHHLIFDGFSGYRVFLPELITLYDAFSRNQPSPLPELPFQFGDYALWQQERWQSGELRPHLDYWRRQLKAPLPSIQLPIVSSRPVIQNFAGAMHTLLLPMELSEALREMCRREGVTLFMGLLAAFNVLLHRYSGQQDIVVGSNTAGRARPGSEKLLGYFLNTIPLRADLCGDPTFRELLDRVRGVTLEALAHDEVPLDQLVAELQPAREPHRNPLFQILFSLEPPLPPVGHEWDLTCIEVETGATKFELCMVLDDRREGLLCRIIYDVARFDAETVERISGHWQTLLRSIIRDPVARISELPILTAAEREQLLVKWNDAPESENPETVLELFEKQVKTAPQAPAVLCAGAELSYGELDRRAEALACELRGIGVGANIPVALCLERSAEMIVGILGVLKVGGAYVPLDPANPVQRLEAILNDCQPMALVMAKGSAVESLSTSARRISIDASSPKQIDEQLPKQNRVSPDDLAYILNTSGSTGSPKGVQITHGNLAFSTDARLRFYQDPPERFLLLSSYAFDSSVAGIFHTLATGGALVIPPADFRWESRQLTDLISRHAITHLLAVPSLYVEILNGEASKLASLRSVIVAGETCSRQVVNLHYETAPQATLFNEYGPTEATVWSTVFECEPASDDSSVPIGRPIPGARVYVLDQHMGPTPIGVPGELYIGGPGVSRGYLNQSSLTSQSFIPDRFSSDAEAKLYRTGDLARFLPSGDLEFLGRSDQQIKIRGLRIELDEIEAELARHPSVREAAVISKGRPPAEPILTAYLVAQKSDLQDDSDLRAFLRRRLPGSMIPANFHFVEALPRTSNGKVDRVKLTEMKPASETKSPLSRGPANSVESRMLAIWKDVLKKTSDDVTEDFFELGGHSLLAAKLLTRIEQEFSATLTLAFIFQSPTIAQMASALRTNSQTLRDRAIIPIQKSGLRPPLFWIRGGPRFRTLAHSLGTDRPFLGVDLPYADGIKLPIPHRLEDIAAYLVKAIREEQECGPYYIGGLCVNAVIAYEVAQQLVAQGQKVELLAMVDAHNHAYYKNPFKDGRYTARIRYHLANLIRMDAGETGAYLRDRMDEARRKIERITWRLSSDREGHTDDFRNTDSIVHPAFSRYQPKPYAGRVVLLQSSEWPKSPYFEFKLGWEDLADTIDFHRIQADHAYLFDEPHVETVAATIARYLGS